MTLIWALLATVFGLIIFHNFPDLYYDHKRDVRRAKEAEDYRKMMLLVPVLVEKFKAVTMSMQGMNETMGKFVNDFNEAFNAESYRLHVKNQEVTSDDTIGP